MLLKVEAYHDGEMWCARGLGEDIFTQGNTLDELVENLQEAVNLHFEDGGLVPEVLLLTELSMDHATVTTS